MTDDTWSTSDSGGSSTPDPSPAAAPEVEPYRAPADPRPESAPEEGDEILTVDLDDIEPSPFSGPLSYDDAMAEQVGTVREIVAELAAEEGRDTPEEGDETEQNAQLAGLLYSDPDFSDRLMVNADPEPLTITFDARDMDPTNLALALNQNPPAASAPTPPPPHTPLPTSKAGRRATGLPEVVGQCSRWVGVIWRGGPGRLGPAVWWAAERGWRHPWLWAAVLTAGVVLTRVTVGHVAIIVLMAGALALGTNGGAAYRRQRYASLAAVRMYRKRRRRIQRRWVSMWSNAGLVRAALHPGGERRLPKLTGAVAHRDGVTAYVAGEHVAVGVSEVMSNARALTESVGALSLRVTKPLVARSTWHRRTDLLSITFKFTDPFPKRPIKLSELPPPSAPGRVVIGLDEEGRGLEQSLFLPKIVVGAPGSGKSTEVWTTLRALRTAGIPFRLRVFDPKGGLELGDLKDAAYAYESLPSKWPQFLGRACEALRVRQEIMARTGIRKAMISEEFPLDLMLIDELVTVLAFSRGQEARVRVWGQDMSAKEAFTVYLSQIRASLGSCIALSQLGEKNILGPARGMFPYISCLRVGPTEKELVDILLGQGAHNAYPAHELDPSDPNMAGRGWVRTKEGVIMYRSAYMDDAERAQEAIEIGKATARYRARGQRDPEVEQVIQRPRGRSGGSAQSAASVPAKTARGGAKASAGTRAAAAKKAGAEGAKLLREARGE